MTETTDITSLREEVEKLREELSVERNAAINLSNHLSDCAVKLKEERQRAENWSVNFENERARADKLAAHIEAMKGKQAPVAWKINSDIPCHNVVTVSEVVAKSWIAKGRSVMPLYDRPQKPVISKEKLCDWLEDNFDIDDSQRAAFAACFAHCCDCIVQSSSAPVGEIVAWAGTDREKGISREVDFRFFRFDVLPGTKLYAVEPAPAAKSDLLTRSQALAVETRALACRIKAGD
ncbi:hypothetical protein ERD95_02400 [Enterobacteriaceae bacterium ML5]|nr:hypothetical protein ERD95_02400 [Enterobacteriaceae bacterium ML5]